MPPFYQQDKDKKKCALNGVQISVWNATVLIIMEKRLA